MASTHDSIYAIHKEEIKELHKESKSPYEIYDILCGKYDELKARCRRSAIRTIREGLKRGDKPETSETTDGEKG